VKNILIGIAGTYRHPCLAHCSNSQCSLSLHAGMLHQQDLKSGPITQVWTVKKSTATHFCNQGAIHYSYNPHYIYNPQTQSTKLDISYNGVRREDFSQLFGGTCQSRYKLHIHNPGVQSYQLIYKSILGGVWGGSFIFLGRFFKLSRGAPEVFLGHSHGILIVFLESSAQAQSNGTLVG